MKKFFHYLAAALLVGSSLAAVSCSDDPEDSAPTPNFPNPTEGTTEVNSAELYSIEIKPNMDWVVSLPTAGNPCFTLLDESGTEVTEVYTLRGKAVKDDKSITIKVKAADIEVFEEMPPVELTMTMGKPAQSKTIATFIIPKKDREFKFYMAQIEEETGNYITNEDGSGAYLYNMDDPKTLNSETSVTLEKHDGTFYGVRMLVESNGSWTLAVPDWIDVRVNDTSATTGKAGQSAVELRANTAAPTFDLKGATDVACKFLAKKLDNTDIELATLKVSMEDLTGLLECEGLPQEALFSARGNYLASTSTYGISLNGFITAPDGVQIFAIGQDMWGDYEQCGWVTPEIGPWDEKEGQIQMRNVSIKVAPQRSTWDSSERQANIYVLPATLKDVTVDNLLAAITSGSQEYEQYRKTIKQEPSTWLLNKQNSLAMNEQGVNFETGYSLFDSSLMMKFWMNNDNGLYYKLTYTDANSVNGGALDIGAVPDGGPTHYTSYKIYGYGAESADDYLPADNKWITLDENRNPETNVVESFTVQMNFTDDYAYDKKYAIIVFYDDTDTAIATLECEFNEGGSAGGGETGAVQFYDKNMASYEGSTIEKLSETDSDYIYYTTGNFAKYADIESVYRVTFMTSNPYMTGIVGLPADGNLREVIDGADWLTRSWLNEGQGVMFSGGLLNSTTNAKGAVIYYTNGTDNEATQKVDNAEGPAVILVIDLKLQ